MSFEIKIMRYNYTFLEDKIETETDNRAKIKVAKEFFKKLSKLRLNLFFWR